MSGEMIQVTENEMTALIRLTNGRGPLDFSFSPRGVFLRGSTETPWGFDELLKLRVIRYQEKRMTNIRDRASPVLDIPLDEPLSLAIELDAATAGWLVRRARMQGTTPESVAEALIEAAVKSVACR